MTSKTDFEATELGSKMRLVRESLQMSQGELERLSGVPQYTISAIETGRTARPDFETVVRLGHAMGLDPTTIAAMAGMIPAPAGEDERLSVGARRVLRDLSSMLADVDETTQRELTAVLRGVYFSERALLRGPEPGTSDLLPAFVRRQLRGRTPG